MFGWTPGLRTWLIVDLSFGVAAGAIDVAGPALAEADRRYRRRRSRSAAWPGRCGPGRRRRRPIGGSWPDRARRPPCWPAARSWNSVGALAVVLCAALLLVAVGTVLAFGRRGKLTEPERAHS
jgi:hypothetical protein